LNKGNRIELALDENTYSRARVQLTNNTFSPNNKHQKHHINIVLSHVQKRS
jgi:hypothetical protein